MVLGTVEGNVNLSQFVLVALPVALTLTLTLPLLLLVLLLLVLLLVLLLTSARLFEAVVEEEEDEDVNVVRLAPSERKFLFLVVTVDTFTRSSYLRRSAKVIMRAPV